MAAKGDENEPSDILNKDYTRCKDIDGVATVWAVLAPLVHNPAPSPLCTHVHLDMSDGTVSVSNCEIHRLDTASIYRAFTIVVLETQPEHPVWANQ